jgi:hypothetical protein
VAGATVEFELDDHETAELVAATQQSVDPELLDFYRLAYCAFRLGAADLAARASDNEALAHARWFYADRARCLLHLHDCCGRPQESSVG